jgi:Carbohydrate-selective porin, OprB family
LVNGSFSTGAQVKFSPNENLDVAINYIYGYQSEDSVNLTGSTASDLAQDPFDGIATRAHNVGLGANFQLGEKIVLAGWGGGTFASDVNGDGDAILYTANLNVSLLDLGKEGAVFSVGGGVPPNLIKNEGGEEDEDTTFLIEAQYKYPINDNILITPGAYYVISPDGNSDNNNQLVGVLRTTFEF